MRRAVFVLGFIVTAAVFFIMKDGPYGPPLWTEQKLGNLEISAAVWFVSDQVAIDHASSACLSQYFNSSVVSVELSGARYLNLGEALRLPISPRWITVYCSP